MLDRFNHEEHDMNYKPRDFIKTMPEWKWRTQGGLTKYIHRPLSFVFSSILANLYETPNQISFISLIFAALACASFLFPFHFMYYIGALFMNLWLIMDCADGNIARLIGGQPHGDFIDATSSYFLIGFVYPAMGMAVFNEGGMSFDNDDPWIIYIGAVASACDTMARLFYHKFISGVQDTRDNNGIKIMRV